MVTERSSRARTMSRIGALFLLWIAVTSGGRSHAGPPVPSVTSAASATMASPASDGVVNLNTATVDELQRLPRIGEEKALRIITHRERTPFKAVQELGRVRGIGLKTLRLLKPWLAVTGPTTLREKVRTPRKAAAASSPAEVGVPVIL